MSQAQKDNRIPAGFSVAVPNCVVEECYEYRGVIMPTEMSPWCLGQLERLEARPDDVFIVTYPKAGTTWMKQLTLLIGLDGDSSKMADKHVIDLVPFLDCVEPEVLSELKDKTSSRIMKTHCLTEWLPEAIRTDDPRSKVIYVVRNPKDIAVSYFHFCEYVKRMPRYGSWDSFFEEFVADRAPYGSWFDNVLPWWNRRNHPNVLFMKYEDMLKDLPEAIRKVAKFLGKTPSDDVIARIASASTFSSMKSNKSSNPDYYKDCPREGDNKGSFMRKGKVGDWKNYFSESQSERFDEMYRQRMAGTGLELEFE